MPTTGSSRTLMVAGLLALALSAVPDPVPAAAVAEPVALLVRLDGDVTVARPGAGAALAASVGMELEAGDRVVVPDGGQAIVLYRTGKLLKAAATVLIEEPAEPGSSSLFASTVQTLGQVATTDARTQPNRQGMIRPIAGAPVPVAPRNGIRVLDVRPSFTWQGVPSTAGYVVQLRREGADAPRPVRYDAGADTVWRLPADAPPLVPGATYVWTVGGEGVGRVAEPQRFTVASADDLRAVQDALAALSAAGLDPAGDGLFLAALAYRDAGLFYEARRALDDLEGQGLAHGRAFHLLNGEVYDALGDLARAEAAFRRADGG